MTLSRLLKPAEPVPTAASRGKRTERSRPIVRRMVRPGLRGQDFRLYVIMMAKSAKFNGFNTKSAKLDSFNAKSAKLSGFKYKIYETE